MGFVLLVSLAWFIIIFYTVMNKKLMFMENTFVYLLSMLININYTWIVYEELKLAVISDKTLDYTGFLIHRSITLPLVVVITMNLYQKTDSIGSKLLKTVLSILFLVIAISIALYFGILEFKKWNIMYHVIYLFLLHFVACYSLKYFRSLKTKEVRES